jgi:hypothetical protein
MHPFSNVNQQMHKFTIEINNTHDVQNIICMQPVTIFRDMQRIIQMGPGIYMQNAYNVNIGTLPEEKE